MQTGTGFTKLETDRVRLMLDGTMVTTTSSSAPSKPSVVTFANAPAVVASPATTTIITTTTAIPEETLLNVIKQAKIDADNVAKRLKKKEKDQLSKKTVPLDENKSPIGVGGTTNDGMGEGNKENNDKEKKQVSLAGEEVHGDINKPPPLEEGQMASPAATAFSSRLLALLDQSLANAATNTTNTNPPSKPISGVAGGGGAGTGGYVAITGGTSTTPIGPEIEGLRSADQLIDQFRANFTILSKKMGRIPACQLVHMLFDRHGLLMNLDMLHDNAMFEEYKDLVGVSGMMAAVEKTADVPTTKQETESLLVGASSQVAMVDQTAIKGKNSEVLPLDILKITHTYTLRISESHTPTLSRSHILILSHDPSFVTIFCHTLCNHSNRNNGYINEHQNSTNGPGRSRCSTYRDARLVLLAHSFSPQITQFSRYKSSIYCSINTFPILLFFSYGCSNTQQDHPQPQEPSHLPPPPPPLPPTTIPSM